MKDSKTCLIIGYLSIQLILLLFVHPINAQTPDLNFRFLTTYDGLSNDDVRCIYQDKDGFMWFGTRGGLDRYDGKSFHRYYSYVRDTTDDLMQSTHAIIEDNYNGIWFANDTNGVVLMNKKQETFIRFRNNPKDSLSLSSNFIRSIFEDSRKNLWFATFGGGLNLFVRDDSTFIRYMHVSTDNKSIGSNNITSIAEDHEGIIWLISPDSLLIRFDPVKKEFDNIHFKRSFSIERTLPVLYIDQENQIWYTDVLDLCRYNQSDKSIDRFSLIVEGTSQPFSEITSVLEIEKTKYIVTTNTTGLFDLNPETGKFTNFTYNPINPFSINSNCLSEIYRSSDGVLWIGSNDNGINIYSKSTMRFPKLTNLVDAQYMKFANYSTFWLCETPDGQVLLGTETNGLFSYNPKNRTIRQIIPELSKYSIFSLYMDKYNRIWICTWKDGLYTYDWSTQKLNRIDSSADNPLSVIGKNVIRMMWDSDNRLWLSNMQEGLSRYDENMGTVMKFSYNPGDSNTVSDNNIYDIFEDSYGNIWVGTFNGLNLFNPKLNSFVRIRLKDENGKYINRIRIPEIFEDKEKRLWIGSDHALYLYDQKTNTFQCYPIRRNEAYLVVSKILEDENHFLWLGTDEGIVKFNPETGSYTDYGLTDDIHYISRNFTAGLISHEGFIYFGTARGVIVFHPQSIVDDMSSPPVFITDLIVNDVSMSPHNDNPVIAKSIMYTDFIELNYKQSALRFNFASLNYTKPEANQYAYKLIGHDKDWVRSGNVNSAYYANLSPGKYVFKVIASNSHGFWNNDGKQITILIKPPFWNTWVFRLLVVIALVSFLFYVNRSRNKAIIKRNKELEEKVIHRTKELNEANVSLSEQHEELKQQNELLGEMSLKILNQHNELEKHYNQLEKLVEERTSELEKAKNKAEESDRLKSAFLANMSHEIRTPMNAIVGFTNLLKDENLTPEERVEFAEIINSNSDMLLVLIDDILDLSLIEANQMVIKNEIISLNAYLDNLYSTFALTNRKDNLEVKLTNELIPENLKIHSDKTRIKQILTNLMNNAIKFTEKGRIELVLKKQNSNLAFSVKDTGIGIEKSEMSTIFERFRKSDSEQRTLYRGTGLGLAISTALAKILGGSLEVESEVGKGSTFTLILPGYVISQEEPVVKEIPLQADMPNMTDKSILIVEDEKANFMYVKKMLGQIDMKVHWAENGLEAVKLVESGIQFHIILMDIKMPEMDGFEAAKIIKSKNPNQIVIALTAYARPEDRNRFMEAGFNAYLTKPIKPNDFRGVIRRYF